MSIRRDRKNQTLSTGQSSYVESILKRFGMESCKPVSTPLEAGKKLQKMSDDDELFNVQVYQQLLKLIVCQSICRALVGITGLE